MKKMTNSKPKAAAEEKPKRKTSAVEPPKAQMPATPKETKVKAPRASARPVPVEAPAEPAPPRRKRTEAESGAPRAKSPRASRAKTFGYDDDLIQEFVRDDDVANVDIDEELTLDPMELPLELLDPELVEVPRPSSPPKPKPKPVTSKRQQTCANCGNSFPWLSVDQLCFNCLKRKLSQRKREDETYPGFTGEAEEEEESS